MNIWEHIAEGYSERADGYIREIYKKLDLILSSPKMGTNRDYLGKGLRAFPFRSHVIYYKQTDAGQVVIIRVLHASQDLESVFN